MRREAPSCIAFKLPQRASTAGTPPARPGTKCSGAPASSAVAYNSGDLFRLNANDTIDRFPAGFTTPTAILTVAAAGRKIFAGTESLLRVDSNGAAFQWKLAGGWTSIGTGLSAVVPDCYGILYGLLNDAAGTVMQRNAASGAWTTIGSGASKLWGGLNVLYDSPKETLPPQPTKHRLCGASSARSGRNTQPAPRCSWSVATDA